MTKVYPFVKDKALVLLGPNCPGLISPENRKWELFPGESCTVGPLDLVSRSGRSRMKSCFH
jgi:succinyl-CoA synthetase alpha subunit